MTGTFKFDPKTETFVFRIDGRGASVSWNRETRVFEAWKTDPDTGVPAKVPTPFPGGLYRTMKALWLALEDKK
jgi:hypothetical protein